MSQLLLLHRLCIIKVEDNYYYNFYPRCSLLLCVIIIYYYYYLLFIINAQLLLYYPYGLAIHTNTDGTPQDLIVENLAFRQHDKNPMSPLRCHP